MKIEAINPNTSGIDLELGPGGSAWGLSPSEAWVRDGS